MNLGTTLSVKNVAGKYELTVSTLSAETLRLGISAVLRGTYTLFMSEKLKVQLQHDLYTSL
jgi:hypothetical protein